MLDIDPDNLVGLYFYDAARYPLLTHSEEVDLAEQIERGFHARQELSDMVNMPARRYKELKLWIDDGWNAVDHLITSNSRLVINIAEKYMHRGIPFLDMIREGNINLMWAIKRFLKARLLVRNLCHLVDSPGCDPGSGKSEPDDPATCSPQRSFE